MRLARRQDDADRQALTVGAKVDFGREATKRAAKTLVLSPPFAPSAQWCAPMVVLSIICKVSATTISERLQQHVPDTAFSPTAELPPR